MYESTHSTRMWAQVMRQANLRAARTGCRQRVELVRMHGAPRWLATSTMDVVRSA